MKYRLATCVWEITLACCFSCRHCGSRAGAARENELTTEECLDTVRQLAELGCRRVSLIGGEVFMRPDWDIILRALTDHGIRGAIITNGYIFTDDLIDRLKAAGIESVAVSIDGNRELHDRFRQEGSFDRAMTALRRLHDAGILTSVITTINSENVEVLEEMYEFLEDSGIFAWQLQACSPMGNAANLGTDYRFDFRRVISFVEDHFDAPFAVGIADNIGYYTEGEGSLRGNRSGKAVFSGCKAGLTAIGIDSTGNVRGCESMYDERFNEGNLRDRTLREIWEDPEAFAYNRKFTADMLKGKCRNCEQGAYCAAGCRSYNYFTGGDLYESLYCAQEN